MAGRPMMVTYLVGFSVVHAQGNTVSRGFRELPFGQIVTKDIVMIWEDEFRKDYLQLNKPTIRVFTFKPL